jgi:hypothetical protein
MIMSSTSSVDWKTDWVYKLVFQFFENAWAEAHGNVKHLKNTSYDCPPYEFYIMQYNKVNLNGFLYCRGNPIRFWLYKGDEFKEVLQSYVFPEKNPVHTHVYRYAHGRFYISPNRKTVVIGVIFGPLYGRGFVFLVRGKGENSRLVHKPGASGWMS